MFGLRYTTGSLTTWNVELHEDVLRGLELTIPDYSHKTKVLWFLFDSISPARKLILRKLEREIMKFTHGGSLPVHDHAISGEHIVECEVMWDAIKKVISSMVVSRASKSAIEEIRG